MPRLAHARAGSCFYFIFRLGEFVVNEPRLSPSPTPSHCFTSYLFSGAQRNDIDYLAIRQSYCNIIAGACLSLGMRYAGSANPHAHAVVAHFLAELRQLRGGGGVAKARFRVDRATTETCLGVCALALSLVMAGTGHLDTLRRLRALRTVDKDVSRPVVFVGRVEVTFVSHPCGVLWL